MDSVVAGEEDAQGGADATLAPPPPIQFPQQDHAGQALQTWSMHASGFRTGALGPIGRANIAQQCADAITLSRVSFSN